MYIYIYENFTVQLASVGLAQVRPNYTEISPMSRATLRRSLYTDLQMLQKHYEDSIMRVWGTENHTSRGTRRLKESVNATLMQLDGNISIQLYKCPYLCNNI